MKLCKNCEIVFFHPYSILRERMKGGKAVEARRIEKMPFLAYFCGILTVLFMRNGYFCVKLRVKLCKHCEIVFFHPYSILRERMEGGKAVEARRIGEKAILACFAAF